MKFKAEHLFGGISVADYETLYFDEPFNIELCKAVNLDRELVRLDVKGKHLTRVVKAAPRGREIPGPVAKVLGAGRIEYVEHIEYDLGTYAGTWKSISSVMTDKVLSSGTFRFVPTGTGVTRIVEGDVTVKVFGVGGMIERFIIADVEKSYDAAAQFTREYLAKKARAGA
jgi:hypothetical protein